MNTGLTDDSREYVKDINVDGYGNIYIRTYDGIWRYNRALLTWEQKISHSRRNGAANLEAITFDDTNANKVYVGLGDTIRKSQDFGENFSLWTTLPQVPEFLPSNIQGYTSRDLLSHGDDFYVGVNLHYPYIGDNGVMRGGVLHSNDDAASWEWLDRSSLPAADISYSLIRDDKGRVYAADSGSGVSRYEFIIDNLDTDTSKPYYFETIGAQWQESNSVNETYELGPEVRNPRSSFYLQGGDDETAQAMWHFQVPESGEYKIFAWWNQVAGSSMRSNVNYRINHALDWEGKVSTDVVVDQNNDGSRWNELAIVKLKADTDYSVVLEHQALAGSQLAVNADAIRIEPYRAEIIIDNEDADFTFDGMTFVDHYNSPWAYPYGPQVGNPPTSRHRKVSGLSRWAR